MDSDARLTTKQRKERKRRMEREKKMNIERLHILEERKTEIGVRQKESKAVLLDAERRYHHSINECDAPVPGTVNHRILAEKQNRDRLDFVKCSKQFQGTKVLTSHARLPRNRKKVFLKTYCYSSQHNPSIPERVP